MRNSLSHSLSTTNDPQLKNKDKPSSKPPSISFRKPKKCSIVLLLAILGLALSRYFQVSSQEKLSLQDTSPPKPETSSQPIDNHHIRKPISDPNEYRHITLPNGLKVIMISDLTVERGYAALVLEAGSFTDPPEIPGLAHLLEHVVIAGSKTYDKETSQKGVIRGAWINPYQTSYYYDGESSDFERTLDMFADSFIDPRFDSEWYEPEIQRIDYEFNEQLGKTSWNLLKVRQNIVDPGSLLARETTGNYETLYQTPMKQGINVSLALQNLFEKYHSANLMTLVILHGKPLDEIQRIINKSLLTKIPNKNLTKPNLDHFPLPLSDKNRNKILTSPDHPSQASMIFQVCGVQSKLGAVAFLIDILKRNHPGGLSSELLKQNSIYRRINPDYFSINSDCGLFQINLVLKKSGRSRFEDIIQTVFAYIQKLIHEGLTQDLANEYFNMKNYLFQYSEFPFRNSFKNSWFGEFNMDLVRYVQEDLLRPIELSDDADIILAQAKSVLLQMNTHNLLLIRSFKNQDQGQDFDYDPMTDIEYSIETLPEELIQKWNKTTGENYPTFKFLRENPFVPKNFDLIKKESVQDPVKKIGNNIWYGAPVNLKTSKVAFYVKFPGLMSLENLFFSKLLGFTFPNINSLTMSEITEAGNSFDRTDRYLKFNAFSDSLVQILDIISPIETNFDLSADEILGAFNESTLQNLFFDSYRLNPSEEAQYLLSQILVHHRCTSADEIKKNPAHRISKFSKSGNKETLNDLFADPEFFVYGNISPQDAITMVNKLTAKFPNRLNSATSVQMPLNISKHNLVYRANLRTLRNQQVLVLNYYQGALVNIKNLYYSEILIPILREFVRNSSVNRDVQVKIQPFTRGNKMGFAISGYSFQGSYDQNQIDMLLENIINDFYQKSKTFSPEILEKMVPELSKFVKKKRASFKEEADEIFSRIDYQVENYVHSEDLWEFFEEQDHIDVKEFLEYVDDFFGNCGKISLQGFSRKDFSNCPLLQEKDQLVMKKQPEIINSTEELQILFESQITKSIIE